MNAPEKHLFEIAWPNPIEVTIDFTRKHLISPERALIDCGVTEQGRQLKTPLGVICYGQRRFGARRNSYGWSVNPDSLIEERRPVVSKIINWLCENHSSSSPKTKVVYIAYIRSLFDWIDNDNLNRQKVNINFNNVENLKAMYVAHTLHLKHKVSLGQTANPSNSLQGITNNSAKYQQAAARNLVMACSGLDEETVKNWAEVFYQKKNAYASMKTSEDEEFHKFHDHLVEIIEAHYQIYVLKNQSVIDSEQWGWLTKTKNGRNNGGYNHTIEARYNSFALVGLYFMVIATGQNESVLLGLKANTVELNRLNKTTYRIGKKGRAKGKEIIIEMGSEHKPIFEKYLAVRNAIAPPTYTFLFPNFSDESDRAVNTNLAMSKKWESALSGKVFKAQALRRFYARKIGQAAQSIGSQSGDLNGIIAQMLQNKPLTACQYSIESLEQAAAPLSQFIGELHDACIEKSRIQQSIPIQLKDYRDNDRSTPAGACESKEANQPKLADGFTDSVLQPSCGKWESCLFCQHYGVHADEIDLKKLLSLKAVIEVLHQGLDEGDYAARFASLIARIQEVIDAILIKNPLLENKVQDIRKACEAGDLDDFWSTYMRTLKLNGYQSGGTL